MPLIKNETLFAGETYLAFEKYPHEEHPDKLNKIVLNLGFVKLVSRVKAIGYNIDYLEHICKIVDVKIITKWIGSNGYVVTTTPGADDHSYANKFKPVLVCRTHTNKDIAPEVVHEAYKRNCISSHHPNIFLKLKKPYSTYIDEDKFKWWHHIPTEDYEGVWIHYLGFNQSFYIGDMIFNPKYKDDENIVVPTNKRGYEPITTVRDAMVAAENYLKFLNNDGTYIRDSI